MNWMRIIWSVLIAFSAVGCAVTPQTREDFLSYKTAVAQVEQSADIFLTDFSDGLKVQTELKRIGGADTPRPKPDYPTTLTLADDAAIPKTAAEQSVQKKRKALAVLHAYNDSLMTLVDGRPESEIRQSLIGLGTELQSLASLAGATASFVPFAAIGARIVKLAQDAANRKQLQHAVLEGRGPVREILKVLEQDVPAMYRLSVVGAQQAQQVIGDEIRRTAAAMKGLIARSSAPIDTRIASRVSLDEASLALIGRKTNTLPAMPVPYPYTAGRARYDAAVDTQTQIFVRSIVVSSQKYDEVIAKQNAYYVMLMQYVALLRRTTGALDQLANGLAGPVDLRAEALGLLRTAFMLRDAMAEYRHPATTP